AHIDLFAGARIAADTGRPVLDREGAEAAQFDPITPRHGIADLVENGVDDVLDIALEQMRVLRGELFDKFGLDHQRLRLDPPPRAGAGSTCQSRGKPSSGT